MSVTVIPFDQAKCAFLCGRSAVVRINGLAACEPCLVEAGSMHMVRVHTVRRRRDAGPAPTPDEQRLATFLEPCDCYGERADATRTRLAKEFARIRAEARHDALKDAASWCLKIKTKINDDPFFDGWRQGVNECEQEIKDHL